MDHKVGFRPSYNGPVSADTLCYTGSPLKLLLSDTLLFLRFSWALPGIILPLWPWPGRALDELYPSRSNLIDMALHLFLFIIQSVFLVSVPWFLGLPFGVFVFYVVGFLYANALFCKLLNGPETDANGKRRIFMSRVPIKHRPEHDAECWIFLNGVAVGQHWLQSNMDRLALTFGRPIMGVHNATSGIIFDVLQCLIQRAFNYATNDVRACYVQVKGALMDKRYTKVVFILHSQGGIEGSMILDWLLDELPQDLLHGLEIYTFGNAAGHFNNPHRSAATVPRAPVKSAATWPMATARLSTTDNGGSATSITGARASMSSGSGRTVPTGKTQLHTLNTKAIKYIEHYANSNDFVSRWGVLWNTNPANIKSKTHPYESISTYNGRVFERAGGGHQFNQHYLDNMFPLDDDLKRVRESREGDFMESSICTTSRADGQDYLVGMEQSLCGVEGMDEVVVLDADPRSPVLVDGGGGEWSLGGKSDLNARGKGLRVKHLSRLWLYRNGGSPKPVVDEGL